MTVAPGSTIGIVGGGQLGRMLSVAAAQLGYRCHIFDPHEHPPAADVAANFTRAAFDDIDAIRRFGYDGKGQAWIRSTDEAGTAWESIGLDPAVAETGVDFTAEFSVIVAR